MISSAFRRTLAPRSSFASSRQTFTSPRHFHASSRQLARKDAQDKDSLKPEPNEYSKSGSDSESAAIENTAFDPKKTSPEEQQASAAKEGGEQGMNNPLEASPANHEFSKPQSATEGRTEGSVAESKDSQQGQERARTSGGGGAPKSGGGKYGGGSSG